MSKLALIEQKIYTLEHLIRIRNQWKKFDKTCVFTNGCFDILHRGHISYLLQAADMGDKLIIGINTDESVKRLKGATRPVQDQYTRALNLAAHTYVDAVVLFEEDTPLNLIKVLKPDLLVKGGDYNIDTIVGANEVVEQGGKVVIIPTLEGYSTSNIIERMK